MLRFDVERHRARVLAKDQKRNADGRDMAEQMAALAALDEIAQRFGAAVAEL